MSELRRFLSLLGARAGSLLLGVLASVVIARALPPDGRGTYYMAVAVAAAATALGHLSVEQAQTAQWADPRLRPALAANGLPLGLGIGTASAALALFLAHLATDTARLPGPWLLVTACAGVPLATAVLYTNNTALLGSRPHLAGRAALAGSAAQCGTLLALGATGHLTVHAVVACWLLAPAVHLLVLAVAERRAAPGRPSLTLARATCGKGLRLHPGSAASYLLLRSDLFVLNTLAGPHAVGLYTLAVTLAEFARLAVGVLWQSSLSGQFADSVTDPAAHTARTTRLMLTLALASALTTSLLAALLVRPVYGPAYADCAALVALLAPGVALLAAGRSLATHLVRVGGTRHTVGPAFGALALNTALNLLLVPRFGATGCALASTVSYTALALVQARLFVRLTGTPWRHLLPGAAELAGPLRRRVRHPAG